MQTDGNEDTTVASDVHRCGTFVSRLLGKHKGVVVLTSPKNIFHYKKLSKTVSDYQLRLKKDNHTLLMPTHPATELFSFQNVAELKEKTFQLKRELACFADYSKNLFSFLSEYKLPESLFMDALEKAFPSSDTSSNKCIHRSWTFGDFHSNAVQGEAVITRKLLPPQLGALCETDDETRRLYIQHLLEAHNHFGRMHPHFEQILKQLKVMSQVLENNGNGSKNLAIVQTYIRAYERTLHNALRTFSKLVVALNYEVNLGTKHEDIPTTSAPAPRARAGRRRTAHV